MRHRLWTLALTACSLSAMASAEDCPAPVREHPRFPASMARVGVGGVTVVLARIDECGRVVESKLAASSGEPDLDAAAIEAVAACPEPRLGPPRYPAEMMRKGIGGRALVAMCIDACGRVLEAKLAISSKRAPLDQAALDAAAGWILPKEMRERAVDGWVRAPVSFGGPILTVAPKPIAWPKSHRRPVYRPDDSPIGVDRADEAEAALRDATWLKPAYPKLNQGFYLSQESGPREYWLFLHSPLERSDARQAGAQPRPLAAVRYRLHDEEPGVVRTAFVCDGSADECQQVHDLVAAGLPFAKPAP